MENERKKVECERGGEGGRLRERARQKQRNREKEEKTEIERN